MPAITQQFNYDERLLNALTTSEQYRKDQEDEARRIAKIEDPTLRGQSQYGAWMSSRREGDFAEFAIQQQEEVHDVAHYIDGKAVCSCGLITEVDDKEDEFWNHRGTFKPLSVSWSACSLCLCLQVRLATMKPTTGAKAAAMLDAPYRTTKGM